MKTDKGFAESVLSMALKGGADMAEVYQGASSTLSADAKDGRAESLERSVGFGYGVRVIKGGRLGFSYSTDRAAAEAVVGAAVESARYTEPDPSLDLPSPASPEAPEVYDPAVASISEKDAIERAVALERASVGEDPRIKKVRKASASFSVYEMHIMNTKGVSYGYPSTYASAHIMSLAEGGGDSQVGWDFSVGRFLSEVSFEGVGRGAAKRALMMLGARRIAPSRSPVVFDSTVGSEFLSVFASMLSSESVQKGRSLLKGREGQKIMSALIDVVDDGSMPRGPGSRPVDDEGVPARRKVLVKGGVLQGFMYSVQTARKEGRASTGNAARGGYGSVPSVGPSNLYISPAQGGRQPSLPEMLKSAGSGLYVMEAMGVHTVNRVTGEFSIGVSGLWVEGGALSYPVKETLISGNVLDLFGSVEGVGDDLRFYGTVGSPSLLFGPVDISA